jgi:hypothetical protein
MKPVKITVEFMITPEDYKKVYEEWNKGLEAPSSLKQYHDFISCVLYRKFGIHTSWRKIKNTTTIFSNETNISNLKVTCCEIPEEQH